MADVAGFPYFELQFDAQGKVVDASALQQAIDGVATGGTTDLFVLSRLEQRHGGGALAVQGPARSHARCDRWWAKFRSALASSRFSRCCGRRRNLPTRSSYSGAASAGSPVNATVVNRQLDALKGVFDNPNADAILAQAKLLVAKLDASPAHERVRRSGAVATRLERR